MIVIYNNYADSAAAVADSTVSGYPVTNMQNDVKSFAHRSVGTTVEYTFTWATDQPVGAVALPATNMTGTSTIRVQVYDDLDDLITDSGVVDACPGPVLGLWDWTGPINLTSNTSAVWGQPVDVNAFAYGGASKSLVVFQDQYAARKVVVTLDDPNNPAGFIDCSRVVIGDYWRADYNPNYGSQTGKVDTSTNLRTEAGDLRSDTAPTHTTLALSLDFLNSKDRLRLQHIISTVGITKNIFVSLSDNNQPVLDQDWMIYGKRENSTLAWASYNNQTSQANIESW